MEMWARALLSLSFNAFLAVGNVEIKPPTVVVAILARNKAHTLPYFLTNLEGLRYPKDRIALWIRSDHNVDATVEILTKWLGSVHGLYHSIDAKLLNDRSFVDETGPSHWSPMRYNHTMRLRQEALEYARHTWADYLLMLDSDVFLTNPDTLRYLVSRDVTTVVAPMLDSVNLYSNFWHGMTDDFYYKRTDDYVPMVRREKLGCFAVPMVHSCVLIDLHRVASDSLTYLPSKIDGYAGPDDDIIAFALSANDDLTVCNEDTFGYVTVPLEHDDDLSVDYWNLLNLRLEVLVEGEGLRVGGDSLKPYAFDVEKDRLGFDRIFLINLRRREDRLRRMLECFRVLGLEVEVVEAVDGKNLSESQLKGIDFLPGYADPYHKRPMKLGEIGCFLSHYNVWKEVSERGYDKVLVLEDDVRFQPFFRARVDRLMEQLDRIGGWDFVYFGRKKLQEADEPWVEGSDMLVKAGYSYWTLGYALSLSGARKLLEGEPLSRLLPVDEYLPILFDKHPIEDWKRHFVKRNLEAFSVAPLLLYPTHYTGEEGYTSDTEDSIVVAAQAGEEEAVRHEL